MLKFEDQIEISRAPSSLHARSIVTGLICAMRKLELISVHKAVVVSMSFVGDREMAALNSKFRGKKKPTDILSFEQNHSPASGSALRAPSGILFLGDLVICLPVLKRQAREQGHGQRNELAVLLAHGLLHLLGYDHERSAAEDRKMKRLEKKLLNAAGFSSTGLIGRNNVESAL